MSIKKKNRVEKRGVKREIDEDEKRNKNVKPSTLVFSYLSTPI